MRAVEGTIYDSVRAAPIANALIQIVRQDNPAVSFTQQTDSLGRFRVPGVRPGRYVIGFLATNLDELGLSSIQRLIDVDSTDVQLALYIPGGSALRTRWCGTAQPHDSSGAMLGFVRDADNDLPIIDARVVAVWREMVIDHAGLHRDRREVPVKVDSAGWYVMCGLPSDGPIAVRAELGARSTGFIEAAIPPNGVLVRDFALGRDTVAVAARDSAASPLGEAVRHGTAQLVGIVRDPAGKPLSGAHLTVWGAGASGVTNTDGRFAFDGLPSGTQTLEVNYLGFAPLRLPIDLASGRTDTVTATLTKAVHVLDVVQVYGKKKVGAVAEFEQRRERGLGHFLTAADIEKRQPFQVSDLFYTIPGMRVVPDSNFDYGIVSSRSAKACYPTVYINGVQVIDGATELNTYVLPNDILGMEVYEDGTTTPPQYRLNDCGAVLIWTK